MAITYLVLSNGTISVDCTDEDECTKIDALIEDLKLSFSNSSRFYFSIISSPIRQTIDDERSPRCDQYPPETEIIERLRAIGGIEEQLSQEPGVVDDTIPKFRL